MSNILSTGSRHTLTYVPETIFGTTPSLPEMTTFRHTTCSLVLTKESLQSAELRSDAQIADLRHGNRQTGGDTGFELSFSDFDPFLAAAVRGTWGTADPDTGIQTLKAGVQAHSFTFERGFTDIGQYQRFTGCQVNTLSLSIQPNAMITGTVGIVGLGTSFSTSPLDNDPVISRGGSPLDGFSGSLLEGGIPIAVVTGVELSIDNAMNPAFVLGTPVATAILPGRINLTGTLTAYFQNMDLLNKFVNETESSLSITLGDGLNASYILHLPRIKYSSGDNPVDGEGATMLNMAFQALLDEEVTKSNIVITRYPAINP